MPRYTTAKEAKEHSDGNSDLEQALLSLTDNQLKFWNLMNAPGYTQEQAYREAFELPDTPAKTLQPRACALWNSDKFTICRMALAKSHRERSARSLEYRIAEMEAFAEEARQKGQYGAAFQALQAAGKLEGHYIDKKQVEYASKDGLDILKAIAQDKTQESIEFARKEARALGLEQQFNEWIKTLDVKISIGQKQGREV